MAIPKTVPELKAWLRENLLMQGLRKITPAKLVATLETMFDLLSINTWQAVVALVPDGTRVVMQITDWTGGTGPKPDIGGYYGPAGSITNLAGATDLRGLPGLSPVLALASGLPIGGKPTRVLKLAGYSSATTFYPVAAEPAPQQYLSVNGNYTSDIAYAMDIRGTDGNPGVSWRQGNGVPTSASQPQRSDGVLDYYIDLDTLNVYRQSGGGNWGSPIMTLKGAPGTLTASAFPDTTAANGKKVVLQNGTTLERVALGDLPVQLPDIYRIGTAQNLTLDSRALLYDQYADAFQGKTLLMCEKWDGSQWIVQSTSNSSGFQRLFSGRVQVNHTEQILAGERFRLTIDSENNSEARMLGIFYGYFGGSIGFPTHYTVGVEVSNNAGASWNTTLNEISIPANQGEYYNYIRADCNGRTRLTLGAVGAAGASWRLHGIGAFTAKTSNQGRYWGRYPMGWSWRQYLGIGTNGGEPATSAALEINATDAGLLLPRMTTAQRDAIQLPANGLLTYVTDAVKGFSGYVDGVWRRVVTGRMVGGVEVVELPGDLAVLGGLQVTGGTFNSVYAHNGDGAYPVPLNVAGIGKLAVSANLISGNSDLAFINANLASDTMSFWMMPTASSKKLLLLLRRGSVGIGLDPFDPLTSKLHVRGDEGHNQFRLEKPFTPASATDPNGQLGQVCWDANYMYVKVSASNWKRTPLTTW